MILGVLESKGGTILWGEWAAYMMPVIGLVRVALIYVIIRVALPLPEVVARWDGVGFAAALRHNVACKAYNPHFRQLLHVGYKVAAEMHDRFTTALERHAALIAVNVTENLYERHIRPLFFEH